MTVEAIADLRSNVGEEERFGHSFLGLFGIGSGHHVASICQGSS